MSQQPPEDVRRRITEALGPSTTEGTLAGPGGPQPIFEAPAPTGMPDHEWTTPQLEELRAAGIRAWFAEGGTAVRACWGVSPADVIELEEVGSHSGAARAGKVVRAIVEDACAILRDAGADDAFEVHFADAAGLDVRFRSAIPEELAHEIDRLLLDRMKRREIDLEDSYIFMNEIADTLGLEWEEPDDDDDGEQGDPAVRALIATGRLRFWWD